MTFYYFHDKKNLSHLVAALSTHSEFKGTKALALWPSTPVLPLPPHTAGLVMFRLVTPLTALSSPFFLYLLIVFIRDRREGGECFFIHLARHHGL